MKKKILAAVAAVAIAVVAVINMDLVSRKQEALSALHLANIEALAQGESGGTTTCHNTITQKDKNRVFYCGSCSFVENSKPSTWSGTSTCSH